MSITIGVVKKEKTTTSKAFTLISEATNNLNVVSSTYALLNSIVAIGLSANIRYLVFFNENIISPDLETISPEFIYPIPASTEGAGFSISFPKGVEFEKGLIIGIISDVTDIKTTVDAGDVILNLTFENK